MVNRVAARWKSALAAAILALPVAALAEDESDRLRCLRAVECVKSTIEAAEKQRLINRIEGLSIRSHLNGIGWHVLGAEELDQINTTAVPYNDCVTGVSHMLRNLLAELSSLEEPDCADRVR